MGNRLSVNMTANIVSFAVSITVSMWLTPFIIKALGAEAYGFIPLTQQIINYMTVITIALNGMIARFFTYAVKSGDKDSAQRYFNTSIVSSVALSLMVSMLLIGIIVFIQRIIKVPDYLLFDVRISLAIYGLIFILSIIGASFGMAMFCENRLDISGILTSINIIIRSLFIILLLNVFTPQMWFVSLGSLVAAAFLFFQNIYYFNKLLPDITINIKKFDFLKLKELLLSGMWSSINYIGAVLFLQIDILVANWALGPKLAGEYSAVLQLSNLLRGFVSSIVVVFGPTMVELYSQGKTTELVNYSNKSVRITGIIMALPVGLACSLGEVFLKLWLGEGFAGYGVLLFVMTIHLSVNLSVQPLFGIFSAANKVKIPAIVTLIMGVVNLSLAILLSITFKLGAFGITIAALIVLTAKNLMFTPIYSSLITRQPLKVYYRGILFPVAGVVSVILLGFSALKLLLISSWVDLFVISISISIIYMVIVYFLILNREDRQKFNSFFRQRLNTYSLGGR